MAEKEVLAMALEIERKFLVDAKKIAALNLSNGEKISQGYLCTEPTVRVRTKGARAFLTVKRRRNAETLRAEDFGENALQNRARRQNLGAGYF